MHKIKFIELTLGDIFPSQLLPRGIPSYQLKDISYLSSYWSSSMKPAQRCDNCLISMRAVKNVITDDDSSWFKDVKELKVKFFSLTSQYHKLNTTVASSNAVQRQKRSAEILQVNNYNFEGNTGTFRSPQNSYKPFGEYAVPVSSWRNETIKALFTVVKELKQFLAALP
jgi:hypothetical protein